MAPDGGLQIDSDSHPGKKRRGVVLLSGGIDSPVAAWLAVNSGLDIYVLHMDNRPFTNDQEIHKVELLVEILREKTGQSIPYYTAPHGKVVQTVIARNTHSRYQCVLCRRMMFRTAEILAKKVGADVIITGESLGQVASQTLQNMAVEEEVVGLPILRPLLGLDKTEIMSLAREIGTYDISTSPGLCCTLSPHKPTVKATLKTILAEEEKMDVEKLLRDMIESLKHVNGEMDRIGDKTVKNRFPGGGYPLCFSIVQPCSADVLDVVPDENLPINLSHVAKVLEKHGIEIISRVRNMLVCNISEMEFFFYNNGRMEFKTGDKKTVEKTAEQIYKLLGFTPGGRM